MKIIDRLKPSALELFSLMAAAVIFFPIYFMISISMKTTNEYFRSPMGLPERLYLDNYITAWRIIRFPFALWNSTFVTAVSLVLVILLGALAAFPLSRIRNRLSLAIYLLFVSGIMLPFQSGMVPLITLLKSLKLMNTFSGLICVYVATNLAFVVFLYVSFIKSIPRELDESAIIDGCPKFKLFWRIIFPLMKPVTATVIIVTSLGIWNDFLTSFLIIHDQVKRTIPSNAFIFFNKYSTNWGYGFAVLVLAMIPLVALFLALQKHFINGIASGAVKG